MAVLLSCALVAHLWMVDSHHAGEPSRLAAGAAQGVPEATDGDVTSGDHHQTALLVTCLAVLAVTVAARLRPRALVTAVLAVGWRAGPARTGLIVASDARAGPDQPFSNLGVLLRV